MVARIRSISSAGNASKYFYFTEKNYECAKGWHDNKETKELGDKLTKESFENALNGNIKEGVELGRKTKDGVKHHPGQELILSAPKSVSIMALVAKDKRLLEAHEKAVTETLSYVERHLIYSRVQEDGIQSIEKTDNTRTAKFTHITSRGVKESDNNKLPDPQLHTHCIITNATKCKDGKYRSIVFDKLYENQMNIGELYRIELGRNCKELGYELDTSKDKAGRINFELKGVPESAIEEFSQRRKDILKTADEHGITDAKGLDYISKINREEKISESQENLLKNWQDRSNTKKLENAKESAIKRSNSFVNASSSSTIMKNSTPEIDLLKAMGAEVTESSITSKSRNLLSLESNLLASENLLFAIKHLSEREAVWESTELHKTVWQKSEFDLSIKDIELKINENADKKNILQSYDKSNSSYTTTKSLALEKEVVKLMQDEQKSVRAITRDTEVDRKLEQSNLTIGQKDAAKIILTSKDRIIGVQGSAGTGKTTMLKAVKEIAGEKDYELMGLAPTKAAATVLSDTVGIEGKTLRSFTMKYEGVAKGRGTQSGISKMKSELSNKIVILDEASLASSKDIKNLSIIAQRLNLRVVMIGDAKQQHGVEAGKPFYYLQKHGMNTAIQRDIKRQEQNKDLLKAVYESEKAVDSTDAAKHIYQALKSVGNNNISDVSEIKRNQEKAEESTKSSADIITNQDLAKVCYGKWKKLKESGKDALVIAPSNDLRDKISSLIRDNYTKGESQEFSTLTSMNKTKAQAGDIREYVGDEIVSFERDIRSLGIKSGDTFTIEKINLPQASNSTKSKGVSEDEAKAGSINLVRESDNQKITWNPQDKPDAITLYKAKNIEIAKGEKIRWTKNSKKHSFIINGDNATIESIKKDKITVRTAAGEKKVIKQEDARFMDYGYTSSTYSSQGKTADYVIGIARAKESFLTLSHQRSFYVTLSRAAKEAHLVIDNYKDLIQSLSKKEGDKTSSIEHQSKIDNSSKAVVKEKPEVGERVKLIKSLINEYVKEYDNIQTVNKSIDSINHSVHENIIDLKTQQKALAKNQNDFLNNSSYKNPDKALEAWNKLLRNEGIQTAISKLQENPKIIGGFKGGEFLFIKTKDRRDATNKVHSSINQLVAIEQAKDNIKIGGESTKSFEQKLNEIFAKTFNFKTQDVTYTKMKRDIFYGVKEVLLRTDNIGVNNLDIKQNTAAKNMIASITKSVTEKIIEYKERFQTEPEIKAKTEMFLKSKYEYEMKGYYKNELSKSSQPKTQIEKIKHLEKINSLSKIDANITKKDDRYITYNSSDSSNKIDVSKNDLDKKEIYNRYGDSQARVTKLTTSYINQGYDLTQASNIANKIISYEITNNTHPGIEKLQSIEQKSGTHNLDKKIITNIGFGETDSQNLLSKVETAESQKYNRKELKDLGFNEITPSNSRNSISSNQEQSVDKTNPRTQVVERDKSMEMEI